MISTVPSKPARASSGRTTEYRPHSVAIHPEPLDTTAGDLPAEFIHAHQRAKDYGPFFVGRRQELKRLWRSVENDAGELQAGMMRTVAITGAPGAGKSTLLERWGQELEAQGIGFINLPGEYFRSPADFVQGMALIEPWRSLSRELEEAQEKNERATNLIASGWDTLVHTPLSTTKIKDEDIRIVASIATRITERKTMDPTEILSATCKIAPHGFVLAVDEAQNWNSEVDNPFLRKTLTWLTSPKARQRAGADKCGLLLAGLNDTPDVLEKFGVTRPEEIILAGISVDATERLIRQHIAEAELDSDTTKAIADAWAPPLAQHFHVWGHHAHAAGLAAERVARRHGNHPRGLAWAATAATLHNIKLYEQTLKRAIRVGSATLIEAIVMHVEAHGGSIPVGALEQLIRTAQQEPDAREKFRKLDVDMVRERLLHSGLLQAKRPIAGRGAKQVAQIVDQYAIPIPSMLSFLRGVDIAQVNDDDDPE